MNFLPGDLLLMTKPFVIGNQLFLVLNACFPRDGDDGFDDGDGVVQEWGLDLQQVSTGEIYPDMPFTDDPTDRGSYELIRG